MSATPTPAPPQTLKVLDQNDEKLNLKGYSDGALLINNLDMIDVFREILLELKLIRTHLSLLTDEYGLEEIERLF